MTSSPARELRERVSEQRGGVLPLLLRVALVIVGVALGHALVLALRQPGPPLPGPASDPGWLTSSLATYALMAAGGGLIAAGIGAIAVAPVAERLAPVVCAVAALFVLVRDLGWDPYYDNAQRFVDDGAVTPGWLLLLALVAASSPFAIRGMPRLGLFASGCLLWACATSAALVLGGH
ncbi:MAG TPA: hypothetical protein VF250_08880 [Conexibacter sp.]